MATYDFVTDTGLIVADTSTTLDEVNDEYRNVFGADFVVDPETPEGALIAAETTSRQSVARNNALVANQINPNLAGGPFLDAIWALTGGQRQSASRSTVTVTITGVAGVSVPQGSRARTVDGDEFQSTAAAIIGAGGTVSATFESVEFGPIAASANQLNQIVTGIIGWETITNPSAATLGVALESDSSSRQRRRETLALQGQSVAEAIISRVNNITGVRSVAFRENVTNASDTIDGILLVAHSIWVNVQGGDDNAIASAILDAKSAGSNFNGAQSVNVTDPFSGQTIAVLFDRPTEVRILMRVTVRQDATQAIDPNTAVKNSIIRYANGDIEGEAGFIIGEDVSPFEIASAVNRDNPPLHVTLVEISFESPISYVTTTLAIALSEVATIQEADIQVILV